MRILIQLILISSLLLPHLAQANETPSNLAQIIADFKAGESIIDKKIALEGVDFAEEETRLTTEGRQRLNEFAQQLRKIPTVAFEIISHTDKQSEKNVGRDLTRKRAKNVSDYLIIQGIPYQRVFYTGMGAKELLSKKSSEKARNNRIELRITGLKKGDHQIITQVGESLTAGIVIISDERIFYRNGESGSNKSVAVNEVERIDFSYGKSLNINTLENNTNQVASTNATVKNHPNYPSKPTPKVKKRSLKDAPKSTPSRIATSPKTQTTDKVTPTIAAPTKTPKPTAPKLAKPTDVSSDPVAAKPTAPRPKVATTPTKKPTITPPPATTTTTALSPSEEVTPTPNSTAATRVPTNPNAPTIGTTTTTSQPTPPSPQPTPPEVNTPPLSTTPVVTESSIPVDVPTRNTDKVAVADDAAVEALLSRYLDNYILQPRELPKVAPPTEELFNLNGKNRGINTDFGTMPTGSNSLVGATTGTGDESGGFTSVAESNSGWTFQLIRQPLGVEGVNLRLNYVDASEQEVRVTANESLPDLSHLLLGSIGFLYHADNALSYQLAYSFGSKNDVRYQALSLGAAYRLEMGRLKVLPGAKIEYGAGRFDLLTHTLQTNIFTVKNTEFISETVDIDYRENLTSVTPQLGLSFAINNKFDVLVQGGYSVNVLTIGKLRFTGGTENSESKTVREKLDNAGLAVNGVPTIESANLFGVRGVALQAGIVWKLY